MENLILQVIEAISHNMDFLLGSFGGFIGYFIFRSKEEKKYSPFFTKFSNLSFNILIGILSAYIINPLDIARGNYHKMIILFTSIFSYSFLIFIKDHFYEILNKYISEKLNKDIIVTTPNKDKSYTRKDDQLNPNDNKIMTEIDYLKKEIQNLNQKASQIKITKELIKNDPHYQILEKALENNIITIEELQNIGDIEDFYFVTKKIHNFMNEHKGNKNG